MKKITAALLFLFLAFPLTGCYPEGQPKQQAEDEADKLYTWDFGKVKEGKVLKHTFILKNDSNKILNIKDINSSCGCTASEAGKKVLSPGESTSIDVSFNSKGYSGPVKQHIFIRTDSIDKPVIRFIIKAQVIKE